MTSKIDFDKVKVEKLLTSHKISKFDCGDDDINDFFKNDALVWQKKNLATTQVFIYKNDVIGFYCASADSIKLNNIEKKEENKPIREIPAIKIGRLGRIINYKKQKLGEFILKWAIGNILELSDRVGVYFITVDSYPKRINWYKQFGFKKNLHKDYSDKRNISMRFNLHNPSPHSKK